MPALPPHPGSLLQISTALCKPYRLTVHASAAELLVRFSVPSPLHVAPNSERFHALDFDFRSPFPEEGCRGRKVSVRVQEEGVLDAVMMTWDLSLHGDVTYSTRCVLVGTWRGKTTLCLRNLATLPCVLLWSKVSFHSKMRTFFCGSLPQHILERWLALFPCPLMCPVPTSCSDGRFCHKRTPQGLRVRTRHDR